MCRKALGYVKDHYGMNLFIISIIVATLVSAGFFLPNLAFSKENPCDGFTQPLDLKYEIKNGTVNSICRDIKGASLIVSINAVSNGTITLEIPRKIMNPVSSNCKDEQFFVLMNEEEISQDRKNTFGMGPYSETKSMYSRILIFPFTIESSSIEIIEAVVPEALQFQKTCQQKLSAIPPRQQIADGVSPENIICKNGLELIFKSRDNSPACVKPETADKLVQRGWGTTFMQTIQDQIRKNQEKTTDLVINNMPCLGNKECLIGKVNRIVDGDTLEVNGERIRLSLVNTPEKNEAGFSEATAFTTAICPINSTAIVDQDDGQPYDVYDRMVAKVKCGEKILNAELLYSEHASILTQYCSKSEFSGEDWAKKYGC